MNFSSLFLGSPLILRKIFFNIYGYLNDFRRYGGNYSQILSDTLNRSQLTEDELVLYQKDMLSKHLISAVNSPFWHARFKSYNIDIYGDPFLELKKLPILTKNEVKENLEDIISPIKDGKRIISHTSGTTGGGLIFPVNVYAERVQWATWWRYRYSLGIKPEYWCGLFGGRSIKPLTELSPPYYLKNYSSKQIFFSQYHLTEETVDHYVSELEFHKLRWLHGYPSFLSSLADLALKKGLKLKNKPEIITVGAENLLQNQIDSIKLFFGSIPFQHYGLAEGSANFSQPSFSQRLFVDEDFSFVEFISDQNVNKIVGTNFHNRSFPLFRYDCGDLFSDLDCSVFPRSIGSVDGRLEDVIVLPGGRHVGRLDHIFKDLLFVREAQIHQISESEITIKIIPQDIWSKNMENILLQSIQERIGYNILIDIQIVSNIPRTSSGKFRFVVSHLS